MDNLQKIKIIIFFIELKFTTIVFSPPYEIESTLYFKKTKQIYITIFEFPQLDDRVGLFVIEFISNGYSSRAVIKKGSLSLIYKSTVAGQVAYILDENKEICESENTGMWYMNQYFKADPEKGGRILTVKYSQLSTYQKNSGFWGVGVLD